jgi:acetyl-CoA carboxylase biotin carboxyl carrier protein
MSDTGDAAEAAGDLRRVDELLELMREHDLDALGVTLGDTEYELVRRDAEAVAAPQASPGGGGGATAANAARGPGEQTKVVTAPIVGVFYRSNSPGTEPFVSVGDRVEVGQVLCILEAMKLMNEITADYAGTVARIIPENGELVSVGDEMFWIEQR